MQKKLITACLAIAALVVVPSVAPANPILTEPTTTFLPAGAKITATNIGNITFVTSTGTLTCTTATLTGTLISNTTATGAAVEITDAKFGGTGGTQSGAEEPECTGSNFFTPGTTVTPKQSLPWCLQAGASADTVTVKGGKCSVQTSINFKLDETGVGTCEYSRAGTVNGTLVTDGVGSNENTVALSEQAWDLVSGPGLCPNEVRLNMRFSLETDASPFSQVFISS